MGLVEQSDHKVYFLVTRFNMDFVSKINFIVIQAEVFANWSRLSINKYLKSHFIIIQGKLLPLGLGLALINK